MKGLLMLLHALHWERKFSRMNANKHRGREGYIVMMLPRQEAGHKPVSQFPGKVRLHRYICLWGGGI